MIAPENKAVKDQAEVQNAFNDPARVLGADIQSHALVAEPVQVNVAHPAASLACSANEDTTASAVFDDWHDPQLLPDAPPSVIPFDNAMLPESLRLWVMDIAHRMQCPPDFVAVAAMVFLATVLGRKLGIRPKCNDVWLVVANLWAAIIGKSGVMKTPAISDAMRPLKKLEKAKQEGFPGMLDEWEKQQELLNLHYKARRSSAMKAVKAGVEIRPENIPPNPKDNRKPQMPRTVVNNTSVEALAELLMENPNGLLVYCDELIGPLRGIGKQGRGFYLQAWNGTESYTSDRIVRGKNQRIDACCLSFLGGIQPSVIGDYLREANEADGADGLLTRFQMMVYPDVPTNWIHVDKTPDTKAAKAASGVFGRIDALDPKAIGQVDEDDPDGIPYLHYDSEGQKIYDEWYAKFVPGQRNSNEPAVLVSHLSKYPKTVSSLALLIHLADNESGPVGKVALLKALAWAEYLESHAKRAYISVMHDKAAGAKTLLWRIRRGDMTDPFTVRDIYLKHWTHLSNPQKAGEAVQVLCDFGYLREELVHDTGGRPKTQYRINPKGVTA